MSAAPWPVATCAAIFLWWSSALVTRSVIWMSVWSFSYSLYRSWYPKSPNVAMMSLVFPPAPLLPPLPQAASAAAIDRASAGASKPRRSRIERSLAGVSSCLPRPAPACPARPASLVPPAEGSTRRARETQTAPAVVSRPRSGRHRPGRGARALRLCHRREGRHLAYHDVRLGWPHRHQGPATTDADRVRAQQRRRQPDRHRQREHHLPAFRGRWRLVHRHRCLSAARQQRGERQHPGHGDAEAVSRSTASASASPATRWAPRTWPATATRTTTPAATLTTSRSMPTPMSWRSPSRRRRSTPT